MSGIDLARLMRRDDLTREIPIIMLTARGEETDRIGGLDAGVDDYVVKPFSTRELVARIRAVMRRTHGEDAEGVVDLGGLRIDSAAHRVFCGDQPVHIGPTEYRLLRFLLARPERVHSRAQLLDKIWGDHVFIEERTVDVHIRRLRAALAPFALDSLIETVRGAGYRLAVPR